MRVIKFRMWDKEEKIMIDGDSLAFEEYAPLTHLLSRDGIMQYTGLKDRNGVEIYDGDIVLAFLTGDYLEVIWDEIGAMFLFGNLNPEKGRLGAIDIYEFEEEAGSYGFDVVGNRYEHPELIQT